MSDAVASAPARIADPYGYVPNGAEELADKLATMAGADVTSDAVELRRAAWFLLWQASLLKHAEAHAMDMVERAVKRGWVRKGVGHE